MVDALLAAEISVLDARDLSDQLIIEWARGVESPGLASRVAYAVSVARGAVAAVSTDELDDTDRRALATMRRWLDQTEAADAASTTDDRFTGTGEAWAATAERGFDALSRRIEREYALAQGAVDIGDVIVTRLGVLERLAIEPDPHRRRDLFDCLEPVWQTMNGGGVASPYRRLLDLSVQRWEAGLSPVEANARALGIEPASVEPALVEILQVWREVAGGGPIEPWDWWYETGAAGRALRPVVPLDRLVPVTGAYHAALGADPAALGIGFDVFPRPGRPLVPVAYTEFGRRGRRTGDGVFTRARAWVIGAYTAGGLGELTELIHETGHAIHIAAIDTRPAFADWPDSDAFTEAVAELTSLDTAEPGWQRRWLGESVPEAVSLRGRYADVVLDVCWALLEIRLHADPDQHPNDVWADLTSTYLGIVAHRDLPWWAMRGQLVQEPGYMVNYALGPILAADLREAIRQARGDWVAGDPGWYEWVSERVYRWGLERTSGDVLAGVLGRAPSPDALMAEIRRGR